MLDEEDFFEAEEDLLVEADELDFDEVALDVFVEDVFDEEALDPVEELELPDESAC